MSQVVNMGNILVKERNISVPRNGKEMEECMELCDGMVVTVQQGDTLYSLSMRYQVPLDVLLRANPYVDVYNLQEGEKICMPMRRMMSEQKEMNESHSMLPQETEMGMQAETEERNIEDGNAKWERYVIQQGDTLDIVVGNGMGREDDWEELFEEFVERNGRDKIYLLPGVAYYRRK